MFASYTRVLENVCRPLLYDQCDGTVLQGRPQTTFGDCLLNDVVFSSVSSHAALIHNTKENLITHLFSLLGLGTAVLFQKALVFFFQLYIFSFFFFWPRFVL